MRGNAAKALSATSSDLVSDARVKSMREFLKATVPFGTQKTSGYLAWRIATAPDQIDAGNTKEAELTLMLLMVGVEQACLDHGRWTLAWLLTWLPEPPWMHLSKQPPSDPLRPFGHLPPPEWSAAAMAYVKDAAALGEIRQKIGKGGRGRGNAEKDDQ